MKNNKLQKVKKLYDEHYKCIKYEFADEGDFVLHFKNFEKEKIDVVRTKNKSEIEEIKKFIDK